MSADPSPDVLDHPLHQLAEVWHGKAMAAGQSSVDDHGTPYDAGFADGLNLAVADVEAALRAHDLESKASATRKDAGQRATEPDVLRCPSTPISDVLDHSQSGVRYVIAFCRQVAKDGILPSQAWFDETADHLEAALIAWRRVPQPFSQAGNVMENTSDDAARVAPLSEGK